jgi:hypothetical protein
MVNEFVMSCKESVIPFDGVNCTGLWKRAMLRPLPVWVDAG